MSARYMPKAGELLDVSVELLASLPAEAKVNLSATFLTAMLLARARIPVIPGMILAASAGFAAQAAYVVIRDIHAAALAITDDALDAAAARQLLADQQLAGPGGLPCE